MTHAGRVGAVVSEITEGDEMTDLELEQGLKRLTTPHPNWWSGEDPYDRTWACGPHETKEAAVQAAISEGADENVEAKCFLDVPIRWSDYFDSDRWLEDVEDLLNANMLIHENSNPIESLRCTDLVKLELKIKRAIDEWQVENNIRVVGGYLGEEAKP